MRLDEMLRAMDDSEWKNEEPGGTHPVAFCQGEEPPEYQEQHDAHSYWMPTFIKTQTFGPNVVRTVEIQWRWCDGAKPDAN